MSNDSEIVVQLTAETAQLQAGMEQGAATVQANAAKMQASIAEEAAAFNAAVQAKVDAMVRLNAAFAGNLTSAEGVTEAEAALDAAMASGAISATEQTAYLQRLTVAETEHTVAVEAGTVATMNARTAYSASALITDAMTGQFGRSKREIAALANETGIMSKALTYVLSPIGLATAAAAALGYAVFEAGEDFRAMEGAVIATGQSAGFTAGQLDVMANSVGKATGDTDAANEAFQKLASSGRFAGNDLRLVGTAAAEMASMTGQSVGSIIAQIEKLQEDPLKAVAKLNDQFHFLTVAEFEAMEKMVEAGNMAGAASIAYAAIADNMGVKTDQVNEHVNVLIKSFRALKAVWGDTMRSANVALGGGDTAEQLHEAQKILKNMQDQNAALLSVRGHSVGLTAELKTQTDRVTELTAKLHEEGAAAGAVGDAAQKTAAQIDAMAKAHKGGDDTGAVAASDKQLFEEMQLNRTMSVAAEKSYWQSKRDAAASGTKEYQQAVQQLLEIKNKEASAEKSAASKAATASREAARREQADARRTAEVRISTEKEVQAELKAEAKKQLELSQQRLKAAYDESSKDIANKRQQYQNEYADGTISASQLLQLEQGLVSQKLALDLKYLEDKKKLDAGNALEVAKDNASIVAANQDAFSQMLAAEKRYHKNSENEWKGHAKKIEGAMQGAINGMLFQHQTLRQGVANIAMVIGEDFIQQAVMKPLDKWLMGEAQKIAASFSTQTTLQAQRAADSAAEAARGAASVVRAAGVAGAMGTASFAGAPWPIDMGAPAFGAGMAAASMSYAPMASAAGGWSRVPFDGAVTELHKDEMVLPAHLADGVRRMTANGSAGQGGNHFHINAMDKRSFEDAARRNEAGLVRVLKHAASRGHFGGAR